MTQDVLNYQQNLLTKGYKYFYLCDQIDAVDFTKKYYVAVIPGDHPDMPCFNECPIEVDSDEGVTVIMEYLSTNDVDISLQ
jgi:hypothetical protein